MILLIVREEFFRSHHKRVNLQWIPGHCNQNGNNLADFLAKKGAMLIYRKNQEISFHTAKQFIRQFMKSTYQDELLSKRGTNYEKDWLLDVTDKPRREVIAVFSY